MLNRGKQFETKFKTDVLNLGEDVFLLRLPDQLSGYKNSNNICDFILYKKPNLYLLELKSHLGNTFPLANLTQYEHLKGYIGKPGVRTGMILWFIDHDKVIYVPMSQITKMKQDNKKSVNIKMLNSNEYKILQIPSIKKRVFMDSDYSILTSLGDGD